MGNKLSHEENESKKDFDLLLEESKELIKEARILEDTNDYDEAISIYLNLINRYYTFISVTDKVYPETDTDIRNYILDMYSKCEDLKVYKDLYEMNVDRANSTQGGWRKIGEHFRQMKRTYHHLKDARTERTRQEHNNIQMNELCKVITKDLESNQAESMEGNMTFFMSSNDMKREVASIEKEGIVKRIDFENDYQYSKAIANVYLKKLGNEAAVIEEEEVINAVLQVVWENRMVEDKGTSESELQEGWKNIQEYLRKTREKFPSSIAEALPSETAEADVKDATTANQTSTNVQTNESEDKQMKKIRYKNCLYV